MKTGKYTAQIGQYPQLNNLIRKLEFLIELNQEVLVFEFESVFGNSFIDKVFINQV